jgi:hypothetical protein
MDLKCPITLGSVLRRLGRYSQATDLQQRALDMASEALGDSDPVTAAAAWGLFPHARRRRGHNRA